MSASQPAHDASVTDVWVVRSRGDFWIVVAGRKVGFFGADDAVDTFVQDAVVRALEAAGVPARARRADLGEPLERLAKGGDNGSEGEFLERLLDERGEAVLAEHELGQLEPS